MPEQRDTAPEDGRSGEDPSRPPGATDLLSSALNGIGTVGIFGLMVLVNGDIFGQALFGTPIKGAIEIVSLSIVGIVFLQIAHSLRHGAFIRSGALFGVFRRRYPVAGGAVQAFYHLAGAFLFAVIFYAIWPKFTLAWEEGEYLGTAEYFALATWPFLLLILIGSAAAVLQLLTLAWRDVRRIGEPVHAKRKDWC